MVSGWILLFDGQKSRVKLYNPFGEWRKYCTKHKFNFEETLLTFLFVLWRILLGLLVDHHGTIKNLVFRRKKSLKFNKKVLSAHLPRG